MGVIEEAPYRVFISELELSFQFYIYEYRLFILKRGRGRGGPKKWSVGGLFARRFSRVDHLGKIKIFEANLYL